MVGGTIVRRVQVTVFAPDETDQAAKIQQSTILHLRFLAVMSTSMGGTYRSSMFASARQVVQVHASKAQKRT